MNSENPFDLFPYILDSSAIVATVFCNGDNSKTVFSLIGTQEDLVEYVRITKNISTARNSRKLLLEDQLKALTGVSGGDYHLLLGITLAHQIVHWQKAPSPCDRFEPQFEDTEVISLNCPDCTWTFKRWSDLGDMSTRMEMLFNAWIDHKIKYPWCKGQIKEG